VVAKEGSLISGSGAEQGGVRCWRLLQIGGCAGKNERGKWGRGLPQCLMEERKRERQRERAPGAAIDSAGKGGGRQCPLAIGRKQGRATVRGDATRLTGGAGRQRGLVVSDRVQEEERKVRQCGSGAPTGGPGQHSTRARFKLGFKLIQNIQTVQMKFEFLKTLAGSKDTFPNSKRL
jgi:hypothetical protein